MVSIQGTLTLAAVAVGIVLFFGAGGFKGVGQKIGGFFGTGFSDFSSSISSAFTGGLFGGNTNPNVATTDTGTIGPAPRTGTEGFDPIGNLTGNLKGLQNILDSINNIFGGAVTPPAAGQPQFSAPAFNDPQSTRDFNLIQQTQRVLGRPINVERSVAAQRELGNTPFAVVVGDRTRTFATEATARSFLERINR